MSRQSPDGLELVRGSEDYDQCEECLSFILGKPEADPFSVPVDWKALGIPTYPKIIKHPMDLGTIQDKLGKDGFKTVEEFYADVKLVWANAMKFNQPGSVIYASAEKLMKMFDKKFAKTLKKLNLEPDTTPLSSKRKRDSKSGKNASHAEKTKFSTLIHKLSSVQLGKVVEMIQSRCPAALNEQDDVDLEIEVDALDKPTLLALISYSESCISA